MFSWLSQELLLWAFAGALVGALAGAAHYVWRDWKYLSHQWRYRRRMERGTDAYFEELRELEAYRPNAVTEEERARWPVNVARFAFFGALIGAFIGSESLFELWLLIATVHIAELLHVLVSHPRRSFLDGLPDPDKPAPSRWQRAKDHLISLVFALCFLFFAFPDRDVFEWADYVPWVFVVAFVIVFVRMIREWWVEFRKPQPEPHDWVEAVEVRHSRVLMLYLPPVVGGMMFALAIWIALRS